MNAEFFEAIEDIEKEKGIPRNYMYDKIRQAMLTAFRRDNPECEDNVEVIVDEDKKRIEMTGSISFGSQLFMSDKEYCVSKLCQSSEYFFKLT